jgi:hypothetical protein
MKGSDEQTDDPVYADERNFCEVEAWSRDDLHIVMMLYAGSSLDRAREIFAADPAARGSGRRRLGGQRRDQAGSAATRGDGAKRRPADWTGFVLLATFMVSLVFGLHALPRVGVAPLPTIGPFVIAAAAFALLLVVESRVEAPLVDLSFFARRGFVMGVGIGSLSMFSIMSLLLYFNLYAQSREGLGLTALEAGASLLPLSAALLSLALSIGGAVDASRYTTLAALAGQRGNVTMRRAFTTGPDCH